MLLDVINYNNTKNGIGEVLNLARRSPMPLKSDQSSCFSMSKVGFEIFDPIILLHKSYVFVDHEKHALCDSYIIEFIHDATENYYERGKYGGRSFL